MIGGRTLRRLALLGAATMLVASSIGISSALAADTRDVYVGDPDGSSAEVVNLTPASSGNTSAFAVLVENRGGQTVTSPTLTVDRPVVAFHGTDAGDCFVETATCYFSNLSGFGTATDSRQVTVEVAAASEGLLSVSVTVTINESGNPNGSNNQIFTASGSTAVFASTDDAVAAFFAPGDAALLNTKPGNNSQSAAVSIPGANGHAIAIVEGDEPAEFCTGAGVTCFGQATSLTIDFGAAIEPYAELTFFWAASELPKGFNPKFAGVAHLLDDDITVITIPNDPKVAGCEGAEDTDCLVSSSYDKKVGFTLTVRLPVNGYVKGYR